MKLLTSVTVGFLKKNFSTSLENVAVPTFCLKKESLRLQTLYGGRYIVTMIPGNGIGPELMECVRKVFYVAQAPVDFDVITNTSTLEDIDHVLLSVKRNGVCIKGEIMHLSLPDRHIYTAPNVAIRKLLDMFVCLNVCKSYRNVNCKFPNINIAVVRQNLEGEYAMLEHAPCKGLVESLKVCTENNICKVAKWAMDYATANNRKTVTIVHKANIMKKTDGLFTTVMYDTAKNYPNIKVNDIIIDNCTMQLVTNPLQFDMLVAPNLYGLIICNILCGLTGGAGLTSGSNFGDECSSFEIATRSMGADIEGKDIANPVCMLNAGIDLLNHLGLIRHAALISSAIHKTIEVDKIMTPDIGGSKKTSEVIAHICSHITSALADDHAIFSQ